MVSEARRWSTGRRGAASTAEELAGADLGPFVSQAISVGARAITSAGSAQDTFDLERLITEVGTRTVESSTQATEATTKAASSAAEAMSKAAEAARKVLQESEATTRQNFADTVDASTKALRAEVERIFGGDNPELLAKLQPVLADVGQAINQQALEQTDKLLTKVSRQFDPADPTSPFAKQASALAAQQQALTDSIDKNHLALVDKVQELAMAVEVQKAAAEATATLAKVTPLKGGSFEAEVGSVLAQLATGLGDEYADTGGVTGLIQRCKKGDGVLSVDGGRANVVIEMHDSGDRRAWNAYLDEAERNRAASASIGVVRDVTQNQGHTIRVLGSRRVVIAFDPASDTPDLLRTVVQLMRTSAIAASSRRDVEGLETAEENLTAARELLARIDKIRTTSGSIRKSADTIDTECSAVQSGVSNHLNQALDALRGVSAAGSGADPSTATADPEVA